jgi:hypothetical protein
MSKNKYANKTNYINFRVIAAVLIVGAAVVPSSLRAQVNSVAPANMPRIGTVDERFQSFNVEMLEVTGGKFWKPYKDLDAESKAKPAANPSSSSTPAGMDPGMYKYRPPIDLTNSRLRKLTAALAPAYMRVSGTWANTTYFHDSDTAAPTTPPKGFDGVLTRQQWKGVVDFSHAVDAKIITSFATSPGTRDAAGVWTPTEASKFLAYTKSIGGSVAAAEFMNEPTYAAMGGAPKGYDAAAYGRDVAVFRPFIKQAAPDMIFLGPGSVGEGGTLTIQMGAGMLKTEDLLKATGPVVDAFSYHFYGAASQRCATMGAALQTTPAAALSNEWLSQAETVDAFYVSLRDKFDPGKPLWITETADAACGGNPWASTFLDSFRYLDQHGRLAQLGVQVIAHNTLASSDYGLLDENTLTPRPNYWASVLWRKLMGTTVLNPGPSPAPGLHLYAQCLRGHLGGVALLVINTDRTTAQELVIPLPSNRYTLTAKNLLDNTVQLNGSELKVDAEGELPPLTGAPTNSGRVVFSAASITFLAIPGAANTNCH